MHPQEQRGAAHLKVIGMQAIAEHVHKQLPARLQPGGDSAQQLLHMPVLICLAVRACLDDLIHVCAAVLNAHQAILLQFQPSFKIQQCDLQRHLRCTRAWLQRCVMSNVTRQSRRHLVVFHVLKHLHRKNAVIFRWWGIICDICCDDLQIAEAPCSCLLLDVALLCAGV